MQAQQFKAAVLELLPCNCDSGSFQMYMKVMHLLNSDAFLKLIFKLISSAGRRRWKRSNLAPMLTARLG